MARTVNYPKRAEKIKEMIDDLVKEYRRCNTNASTGTYQPPYS